MISEYIRALLFIFIAEMGDKTQILAMMFATKYKVSKVMIGIFIGSLLNHGLAVAFGRYVGGKLPTYMLQMIAGAAFILFAIWTLSENDSDENEEVSTKKTGGAIITVASAFFIGELGDKTQLTAITLSVDAVFPILILLGTVSGMLVTSAIGIFVGSKVGDKIPDFMIKIISGSIFLFFGTQKLYEATPLKFINIWTISGFIIVIGITLSLLIRSIVQAKKAGKISAYKRAAIKLHKYAKAMDHSVDEICRGVNHCGQCEGKYCPIGYIREITKDLRLKEPIIKEQLLRNEVNYLKDKFDKVKLTHSLAMTLNVLFEQKEDINPQINEIRSVIEMILFDKVFPWNPNKELYLNQIEARDPSMSRLIHRQLASLNK